MDDHGDEVIPRIGIGVLQTTSNPIAATRLERTYVYRAILLHSEQSKTANKMERSLCESESPERLKTANIVLP